MALFEESETIKAIKKLKINRWIPKQFAFNSKYSNFCFGRPSLMVLWS